MRLQELRKKRKISQIRLAIDLDMNQNSISRYETGERELPMHHFRTLAKYYNVSLDYLAGLTNTPKTLDGSPYTVKKSK